MLSVAQNSYHSRSEPLLLENKGQLANSDGTPANHVLFYMNTPRLDFYLTKNGLSYVFKKIVIDSDSSGNRPDPKHRDEKTTVYHHRVDVTAIDAKINIKNTEITYADDQSVSIFNNLMPQGVENIKPVKKITIKNVYPSIDWQFIVQGENIKYNFILNSGADIKNIKLRFDGQKDLYLKDDKLIVNSEYGDLEEGPLYSYLSSGEKVSVKQKLDNNILTYYCDDFVSLKDGQSLTIDPPLVWATFFGGSGMEQVWVIERSLDGFIYMLLEVVSTDFPVLDSSLTWYQGVSAGKKDLGILKFNDNGKLIWSSYYGGSEDDIPLNMFCNNNMLIVVGYTKSPNFPTLVSPIPGSYNNTTLRGTQDGFIIVFNKMNPYPDQRAWATYYGSYSNNDKAWDCSFYNNKIYVIGQTHYDSLGFAPKTNAAIQFPIVPKTGAYNQNTISVHDITITEFDLTFKMTWSTFYGGNDFDVEPCFDIDNNGNMCIVFTTTSTDIPVFSSLTGSYTQSFSGAVDIGFTLFNQSGQKIMHSYLGGTSDDFVEDLISTPKNEWVITGATKSNNFPVVNNIGAGLYFPTINGAYNAFLAKFNSNGGKDYCSYYGGNNATGYGLTIDSHKNLYLVGSTRSNMYTYNPMDGSYIDSTHNGAYDGFLLEVDSAFNAKWATVIGGTGDDPLYDIRVSPNDHVFAAGYSQSAAFPLRNPGNGAYFDNVLNGAREALILKFVPCPKNFNTIWAVDSVCYGETIDIYATGSMTYNWSIGSTNDTIQLTIVSDTTISVVSTYLTCIERDTVHIKVKPIPIITFSGDSTVCLNDSMHLQVSGGNSYVWSNGFNTSNISFLPSTSATLTVTATNNNGCSAKDSIHTIVYPLPTPLISGNSTPCLHDTTSLSASGGNAYLWSNSATTSTINITWNSLGTYDYNVIATDANGCSDTAFFTATVLPLPEFDLGNDTTICETTSITLTPGIIGSAYNWNTGATSQSINISTANLYILTVTSTNGCKFSDSIAISVQPNPIITFGGDSTICFSHPITITASGGTTYLWENGMNGSSITFIPSASDSISVTVADNLGCTSTDSVYFEVLPLPIPNISGDVEACAFDTVSLTASGGVYYLWSSGQSTANANFVTSNTNVLNCFVVVTGSNGCFDTAYHQISIHPLPNINLGNDTTICEGTSLLLDAANAGSSYIWNNGSTNQAINVTAPGIYSVTVTTIHSCSNSNSINVGTMPYANASINDVGFICTNAAPFTFTAAQPGGIWDGNGIINSSSGIFNPAIAGIGSSTIIYTIGGMCGNSDTTTIVVGGIPIISYISFNESCAGKNDGSLFLNISGGETPYIYDLNGSSISDTTYSLTPGSYILTVIDNRGCSSIDTVMILPEEFPCGEVDFYIPNIFSPNGDLENDVLFVRSNFIKSLSWFIYDRYGEKVFESKDINSGWDGNYKGLPAQTGVYYWYIKATMLDNTLIERQGNVTLIR